MQFYPPAEPYQGKYKTMPNSVVERNRKTGSERVIFKTADPGPITDSAMRDLIDWYDAEIQGNPWGVAVACEFVFRFLAIHPFQDGNGRLGRGLFLLALLQSSDETLARVARYIAIDRQIERHKEEYYYVLQQCSGGVFHQDPREYKIELFLRYMIKILLLSLKDIEVYKNRFELIQGLPESAVKMWECFKEHPEKRLAMRQLVDLTGLPKRTAIFAVNALLENSLVQKYGRGAGTSYQMVF
jgi:Fic family protein